ncbi:hypothetical protein ACFWVF_19225 [Streptomyces sp. NPDC058659]|uniref:hypothetical protein n=1 Tax=Streptomyces sp. NPDC058659 TaxID=3346581 RepID=UPI0036482275
MVLLSFAVTLGGLVAVTCAAVAVARAAGGEGLPFMRSAGPIEKIIFGVTGFVLGSALPLLYQHYGLIQDRSPWEGLGHGAVVVAGFLMIGHLMTSIRWGMWSDALLSEFLSEVMPVVATAQRRAGDEGADLVEKARAALRDGRGRDALRCVAAVRTLVEQADLPEHAAWAKVSEQILYWHQSHLSARELGSDKRFARLKDLLSR